MDGVKCVLRGKEFCILPLTVGLLRKGALDLMKKNDELVQAQDYIGALEVKAQIIGLAVRQNNPDVTDDDLYELLDLRNYMPAWNIVLGGTGLGEEQGQASDGGSGQTQSPSMTPGTSGPSTDP